MGALLLGSAVAAGWASCAEVPYSDAFPKRILVQHLHTLGANGRVQVSARAQIPGSKSGTRV